MFPIMPLLLVFRGRLKNTITIKVLEMIAIYGAGGFGKETRLLLEAINRQHPRFAFQGFIDDAPTSGMTLALPGSFSALSIAIAEPSTRKRVFKKNTHTYQYPNLIHPDVYLDTSVEIGKGLIICAGAKITVDISLDDFVIINLNATIGHDVKVGAFTSIMPSVNISGNVTIGDNVFIGSGATVLQGLKIGDGAIIGAGAVVTRNVPSGVVAKGVPARWPK
jgi:sugar O-acyltransferase (sialic acid O-acetyltransferase NeuD family)